MRCWYGSPLDHYWEENETGMTGAGDQNLQDYKNLQDLQARPWFLGACGSVGGGDCWVVGL